MTHIVQHKGREFRHLHVHTEYSLLDGANKIEALVKAAKADGQDSIAMTDHGNMHGALEFYNACKQHDVKPIIGCEFYVAASSRFRKHSKVNGYNHLTLLARNYEGYMNLLKLTSLSYIEGLSYRPRIDHDLLSKYTNGINCLSGCLSGKINKLLLDGKDQLAEAYAAELQDMFGKEHFWIELQRNGLKIQDRANESIIRIGNQIGAPLCATNDIHYLRGEDCDFQDTLLCINTNSAKADQNRFRFDTTHLYLKHQKEMLHVFKDLPNAVLETMNVSDQIDLTIPQGNVIFPTFELGGKPPMEVLTESSYLGVTTKYGGMTNELRERLNFELKVIESMGYPEYFLVVQDFVHYAKSQGIPVGPGRGSAAGCLVSYALGITNVDPIKHNLLFERFLNPDRVGLPDIDMDFCKDRRNEILDYLRNKHGDDRVAQIATFGRFGPKAAIRDAARVLEVPISDTDAIAKRMEGESIQECIRQDPALGKAEKDWPILFSTARQLEGMVRFNGTHACGVVIADRPLYELVPLGRNSVRNESVIVTQWDHEHCEKVGLVKFDILGLETLTIIERCQYLIEQAYGKRVDLDSIDMEDPKIYELLSKGDTEGVFQCYSDAAKRLLIEMQPDRFEDIIAAIALNRPGPLESGIAKQFIDRKHGREPVTYLHPDVEKHLKGTYGCMVYQEQIMQLATALAGFSMSDADGLRKAVGKKKQDMLESIQKAWLKGCEKMKKINRDQASSLWEDILKFGRYGFNLSHSASYAYLTGWTAYLRAYYPLQFFAANMTQEIEDTERLRALIRDAEKHDIKVLPPTLRHPTWGFTVVDDKTVRMGIGSVKGLGESFAKSLLDIQWPENNNVLSNLQAIPRKSLRKNVLEMLIRSGMLDFEGVNRGCLIGKVDSILKKVRDEGQPGSGILFEDISIPVDTIRYEKDDTWSETEILREERQAFGFYVSGHPMSKHKSLVWNAGARPISYINNYGQDGKVYRVGGVIVEAIVRAVKSGKNKGKKYARLILEDEKDSIIGTAFTTVYTKLEETIQDAINNAQPVVIVGRLDKSRETPQISVNQIWPMVPNEHGKSFELSIDEDQRINFSILQKIVKENPGDKVLYINIMQEGKQIACVKSGYTIEINNKIVDQFLNIFY
jgi:DNA polymerase III subunit alpha